MIEANELPVLLEEFWNAMKGSLQICVGYTLVLTIFEKQRKLIKKLMSLIVAVFTFQATILDHLYQSGIFVNVPSPYYVLVFCTVIGMIHTFIE